MAPLLKMPSRQQSWPDKQSFRSSRLGLGAIHKGHPDRESRNDTKLQGGLTSLVAVTKKTNH